MTSDPISEHHIDYCTTESQRETVRAYLTHGSMSKAAIALGRNHRTIERQIKQIKTRAAAQGYAPEADMTHPAPPGFAVKGTSTLYDDTGAQRLQWVKTNQDRERQHALMQEAVEALIADIPRVPPASPPQTVTDDLCACYVLSDYHLGQLSYAPETGDDWDTDMAEQMVAQWFGAAIDSAPKAHTGVLAQLGDFMHHDGVALEAITPTSGNILDADTRFQRLVRVAVRSLRRTIDMMLAKHQHVHVLLCEGNHDMSSSVWLREMFAALYHQEPRVTVDTTPSPFYCFQWGRTMLGFHHGHKVKMADLSKSLVGKFPEVYGQTTYRYGHSGHLHHVASKEDQLMVIEQHPTLAAMDSHASRLGFNSQRGASVITYSKQHGEVGRSTIRPEMVQWEDETG